MRWAKVEAAAAYKVPAVKAYHSGCTNFKEFLDNVKNDKGLEGCVLR